MVLRCRECAVQAPVLILENVAPIHNRRMDRCPIRIPMISVSLSQAQSGASFVYRSRVLERPPAQSARSCCRRSDGAICSSVAANGICSCGYEARQSMEANLSDRAMEHVRRCCRYTSPCVPTKHPLLGLRRIRRPQPVPSRSSKTPSGPLPAGSL